MIKQLKSGITIQVIGEYVYDLGPDGKTLHPRSSYRDYTTAALTYHLTKPEDLRARWLSKEQRQALRDQLQEEGVNLQILATALHLPNVDPLDILLHVAFGQRKLTRSERVERLYREHLTFFSRYKPEAREILDTILNKYVVGEAQDVSDTELLRVPPLSERGTFIELAQRFGGGANVRSALNELQELLYSAWRPRFPSPRATARVRPYYTTKTRRKRRVGKVSMCDMRFWSGVRVKVQDGASAPTHQPSSPPSYENQGATQSS